MSKKKYQKGIDSLNKRIAEHKFKQSFAKNPELFYYWEKEIAKFEREKQKKQKQV